MNTEEDKDQKQKKEDFVKSPKFIIATLTFAALFLLPFLLVIPIAIKLLN